MEISSFIGNPIYLPFLVKKKLILCSRFSKVKNHSLIYIPSFLVKEKVLCSYIYIFQMLSSF